MSNPDTKSRSVRNFKVDLVMILAAALLIPAVCVAVAAVIRSGVFDPAAPDIDIRIQQEPIFVELKPISVVLNGDDRQRIINASLVFQVPDQDQKDLVVLHMPEVQGRLLLILSQKSFSELMTAEGKSKLAQEIRETINDEPFTPMSASPRITEVFFTSISMQ